MAEICLVLPMNYDQSAKVEKIKRNRPPAPRDLLYFLLPYLLPVPVFHALNHLLGVSINVLLKVSHLVAPFFYFIYVGVIILACFDICQHLFSSR